MSPRKQTKEEEKLSDEKLTERYLNSRKPELTPLTFRAESYRLEEFKQFMEKRGKPLFKLTKEDLSAFILEQKEKGLSSNYIRLKYYAIKGFAIWLYYRDILREKHYKEFLEDKFKKYKIDKTKSRTKALTPEEVSLVYKRIGDPMLRMLFWVGETYGLRISEYANLKVQHIILNKDDPYIEIHAGKGDKDRNIAILEEDIEHWETWLKIRSGYDLDHDYMFFTSKGKASSRTLQQYYNKMSEQVQSLPKHLQRRFSDLNKDEQQEFREFKKKHWFTAHDLRRTFATNTRTVKNVDMELIQAALGHESVATTEIYIREKEGIKRQRFREQMKNNGS